MSDASKIVGNDEKSNGFSIKSVTVKIKIAKAKDAANPTSRTQAGMGKIIMTMTAINAMANRIVGLKRAFRVKFFILNASAP